VAGLVAQDPEAPLRRAPFDFEHVGALEPFQTPEIMAADLSSLVLDCAAWGEHDPRRLSMLDPRLYRH
jgi:HrpA-like RNA helicase